MRRITFTLAALLGLGACGSVPSFGPEPAPARPAVSHDAMVASMAGNYTWNCTLQNPEGTAQWRFVLQQQKRRRVPETFQVEAGRDWDEQVRVTNDGAALVYEMKDKGKVLVASDGEVIGTGPSRSRAAQYPTGWCTRGSA